MDDRRFSIFAVQSNTTASTSAYSPWKVLTLSGEDMYLFWEMWLGIALWMALSYILVYITAALLSLIMLRNHSWVLMITVPILVMSFIGPITIGAVTSASIALTFSSADKAISCWHCMALGCGQTLLVLIISFSRILATL